MWWWNYDSEGENSPTAPYSMFYVVNEERLMSICGEVKMMLSVKDDILLQSCVRLAVQAKPKGNYNALVAPENSMYYSTHLQK